MTDHPHQPSAEGLAGFLASARQRAEAGDFQGALSAVRDAKRIFPKNIYVLAFERQVEQLTELSLAGKLGDDERTDILESIPGIVERALEGSPGPAQPSSPLPDAAAAERAKGERAAAHEWLKNQYFQHAHEYVKKGEYDHALAEIRRVFIIDPDNETARDFELQINELSRIRRESAIAAAPSKATAKPPAPTPQPAHEQPRPVPAAEKSLTVAEASAPARKKLKPISMLLLFLALALLAFATIFLIKKLESPEKQTPRSTIPSPQREEFAPEQTSPQTDTTQVRPDTLKEE